MGDTSCLFCRISRGEVPAQLLLDDHELLAFRDLNPQAPTHVLIIPKEHISSLDQLREEHAGLLGRMHLAAREVARREGVADQGWRVVTNVGAHGGQSVLHLHLHLLGGRPMRWPPG